MANQRRRTVGDPSRPRLVAKAPGVSLVEFAADSVRTSILTGALPAGERILLDDLAEDLGISPIPVREALRVVATEGLVVPMARRGYTVAPLHVEDLEETYRLRLLLEPLAVQLAVPRLTPADVDQLATELELLTEAFEAGDWPNHRLHHRNFHFGIYNRCESPWLLRFTEMLWANSERYQYMTTRIKGELRQRDAEHKRILKALRAADPERSAEAMREHLAQAEKPLHDYLAAREAEQASEAPDTAVSAT
jgi:DNA-binding GntR family transcriptional regulator